MDDDEFEQLLEQKYAQIVLNVLLDSDEHCAAFSDLRDEVNAIASDNSRGAVEGLHDGEYAPASLNSFLSDAKQAGIVERYLNENGQKRWRLRPSQLSQSQIDEIRDRNSSGTVHSDSAHFDYYRDTHTDSSY